MRADPSLSPTEPVPTGVPEPLGAALAATLAASPDAAFACDGAGRLIAANERAAALFGEPRAALIARRLAAIAPGAAAALAATPPAPGAALELETALGRADGSALAAAAHLARLALPGPALYVCQLRAGGTRRDASLAAFLEGTPAACFQKDRAGRYQLANASCAELLGIDPLACLGRTDEELFAPATAAAIRARDRRVIETGEVAEARITVPTAQGPRRVLLHKFPVRDAAGRVSGVAGIATDVTAHEALSDRLRLREQQLAIFVDNSPAACFQKDLDGRYELLNATCAERFGMDAATCIGKTDEELFPTAAETFRATDREALRRGDVYVCEQAVPTEAGTRHFLTHKFPIRDASGRIVSIAGTSVEITDMKRADRVLREAEARLRAIVQGMPVLLDAFDDQANIVAWNSECERVTGYRADEIIGNPRALELLYPDAAYRAAMMAEAAELRHQPYSRSYDLTAKDGSIKTIEWFNVGAAMRVPGWLEWSVGIDVTERHRLEAALHEAAVLEQRRLGYDLHDGLGQELTGLSLLASSLARRYAAGSPELATELGTLAGIAAHAIVTCKDVARGLAPVDEPRRGLVEALERLTAGFPHPGSGPEVSFADRSSAVPQITLEACNHLYRIAQEALANAVRHAGARHVRIELCTDAERLRLRISDDGRGLPRGAGTPPAGMGLRNMRHRAKAIGARLAIGPGPRGGTIVSCDCANRATVPRRLA